MKSSVPSSSSRQTRLLMPVAEQLERLLSDDSESFFRQSQNIDDLLSLIRHPLPIKGSDLFELISRISARASYLIRSTDDYELEKIVADSAVHMLERVQQAAKRCRADCDQAMQLCDHQPTLNRMQQRMCLLSDKMTARFEVELESIYEAIRSVQLPLQRSSQVPEDSREYSALFRKSTSLDPNCSSPADLSSTFLVAPTQLAHVSDAAQSLLNELHAIVSRQFSNVLFCLIGSHALGLAHDASDYDILLIDKLDESGYLSDGLSVLKLVHTQLCEFGWMPKHNLLVESARMSTLRLFDVERNVQVDLSSKQHVKMSVCKVALISQHISMIPSFRAFLFALKQIVSALGVSDGSTGGLNSFGWTVLAIHFMQLRHQHCFLPIPEYRLHSVHSVQSNSFLSLCNMDCTPLLAPLSQFFDFVAHEFPFKTGSASIIGSVAEYSDQSVYKNQKQCLRIQDPADASDNIGRSMSKAQVITLAKRCHLMCDKLTQSPSSWEELIKAADDCSRNT